MLLYRYKNVWVFFKPTARINGSSGIKKNEISGKNGEETAGSDVGLNDYFFFPGCIQ